MLAPYARKNEISWDDVLNKPSLTLEEVLNNGHILNDYHLIKTSDDGFDLVSGDTTYTGKMSNIALYPSAVSMSTQQNDSRYVYSQAMAAGDYNIRYTVKAADSASSRTLVVAPYAITVSKNNTAYNLPLTVNGTSADMNNNIALPVTATLEDVLNNGNVLSSYHLVQVNDDGINIVHGDTTFTHRFENIYNRQGLAGINANYDDSTGAYSSGISVASDAVNITANMAGNFSNSSNSRGITVTASEIKALKYNTYYNLPLTVNGVSADTNNNITLSVAPTLEDVLNNGSTMNDFHSIVFNDGFNIKAGASTTFFGNDGDMQMMVSDADKTKFRSIGVFNNDASILADDYVGDDTYRMNLKVTPYRITLWKLTASSNNTYDLPMTVNGIAADTNNNITLPIATVPNADSLGHQAPGYYATQAALTTTNSNVATNTSAIGTLSTLNTTAKSSLVAAINENYAALSGMETSLTFSSGLTRSGNIITNNLLTGISGGQTIIGGVANSGALTLASTSAATKGNIYLGASQLAYYDETNKLLQLNNNTLQSATGNGLLLQNSTPAISTNMQYSPSIVMEGQGWKTAATAGSQSVKFQLFNQPVVGTGNPSGNFNIASSINGGAYTTILTLGSTGTLSVNSSITAGSSVIATGNIQSNPTATNSNFLSSGTGATTTTTTQLLFGGSSTVYLRVFMRGATAASPAATNSYASFVIGQQAAAVATTGTHTLFAQQVIKPLSITTNTGTLTNSATLYLEDAATGATNNYNLWAAGTGINRFDGNLYVSSYAGIGTTGSSAAYLTLGVGTTSIAPLNIPVGTLNTTPVSGNIESDGVALRFTNSSNSRRTLASLEEVNNWTNTQNITTGNYIQINGGTGETAKIRVGSTTTLDGMMMVYNSSNNKMLQYGSSQFNLLGAYPMVGYSTQKGIGADINATNTQTFKLTPTDGSIWTTGKMAVGTSTIGTYQLDVNGTGRFQSTLTLAAGTTSIASLNIPSGTLNTTPVSGNIENDGTSLFYTNSSAARKTIATFEDAGNYTAGNTITLNNLGATTAAGLSLVNTTAAVLNTQQYSPAVTWQGSSWTTSTGVSQPSIWRMYLRPLQNAAANSFLVIDNSLNGGSYTDMLTLNSNGPSASFAGNASFTGGVTASAIQTNTTGVNANLFIPTGTSGSNTSTAQYLFGGATNVNFRVAMRGSNNFTAGAGFSSGNLVIGQQSVGIAASGTHGLFAQEVIKPLTILATAGTGVLTNSATLYLEDAATGATNNYNLWTGNGLNRFDRSNITTTATDGLLMSNPTAALSTTTIQYSPALHFQGAGWGTTAAASQSVDFRQYVTPTTGTTAGGTFLMDASLNGGAYSNVLAIDAGGRITSYGDIAPVTAGTKNLGAASTPWINTYTTRVIGRQSFNLTISSAFSSDAITFANASAVTEVARFAGTTGNLLLGTTTDGSYKLDVNGTGRFQSTLNLAAGTTSIAPLNIPSGTLNTTPLSGNIENDGTNAYYTNSSAVRNAILTNAIPSTIANIRYFNTVDQTTNVEYGGFDWTSNQFRLYTNKVGTGTVRDFLISSFGAGQVLLAQAISMSGFVQLGRPAGTSTAGASMVGLAVANPLGASISNQQGVSILPTINQSGTAGYRALFISPLETTTGSGNKYLIDAGTNSAASGGGTHTSKFSVSNAGVTTATQYQLSALNTAPTSATDTGTTGEVRITSGFIYVCVATNTWVRTALTTW
jgi:hypothetical protein